MPGTLLDKKLGIKRDMEPSFINSPERFYELSCDRPAGTIEKKIGKQVMLDYIHVFYTRKNDIQCNFHFLKNRLKKEGMIRVSWPKGNSGKEIDLTREKISKMVLVEGLIGIKVCATNDAWSVLKFVIRKKDRI